MAFLVLALKMELIAPPRGGGTPKAGLAGVFRVGGLGGRRVAHVSRKFSLSKLYLGTPALNFGIGPNPVGHHVFGVSNYDIASVATWSRGLAETVEVVCPFRGH